ncbi:MAG: sugar transferase [Fluviicola sp.]|nr:MAG: sugar transferase [Fluviicola sp.]
MKTDDVTTYDGKVNQYSVSQIDSRIINALLSKKVDDGFDLKHEIHRSLDIDSGNGLHLELNRINDIRYINKHFEKVNRALNVGDYYVGVVKTLENYREARKGRNIPIIGGFVRVWDFAFFRIAPKVWGIRKIYFGITRGKGRLISKAEVLGRLVSCGFEIDGVRRVDNLHLFTVKKAKEPLAVKPSYGPLFKMNRVGKNGKIIGVYKFRTMHPYSEFIQSYLIRTNGYGENGKIKDDFRMSRWSKLMRKYWIDEIPQLLNVLKGDMKLVGVRPVSKVYFDALPEELKNQRSRFKPGCIPPYVAFNEKSSLNSVLECEKKYLDMKTKNPYFTDTKLFFKAIINIVFRGKRSG